MAVQNFEVEGIGTVRVSKRRGARSIRISIASNGEVRVTVPAWASYKSGTDFVAAKALWIRQHLPAPSPTISTGQRVGKAHRLVFLSGAVDAPSSRLIGTEIQITRPTGMAQSHPAVQKVAQAASIRALRSQASKLLPHRLRTMAETHGFTYSDVSIKQLKGRWGSCDSHQAIVLNLFLMQLPWYLIDYVLLHELVHTKYLNHGADFWDEFLKHEPRAKSLRAEIRNYQPTVMPTDPETVVA